MADRLTLLPHQQATGSLSSGAEGFAMSSAEAKMIFHISAALSGNASRSFGLHLRQSVGERAEESTAIGTRN